MARRNRKQKKRRTRRKRGGASDAELQACNARLTATGVSFVKARSECIDSDGQAGSAVAEAKPAPEAPLFVPGSEVEVKPGKEEDVLKGLCEKYMKRNESRSSNIAKTIIKEKKIHPKDVKPQPSNSKCKKTCHQSKASGKCSNKPACDSVDGCLLVEKPTTAIGGKPGTPIPICTNWAGKGDMKILAPSHAAAAGGGRRTRKRRGGNCTGVSKSIIKKFPNPIPCSTPRLLPAMRINVPLDYENITPRQQKTKETKESVKELPGAVAQGAAGGKRRRRRRKSRRKSRKRKSRCKSKRRRR